MPNWLTTARQERLHELQDALGTQGCVALLGESHMGKSAILEELYDRSPTPRVYLSFARLQNEAGSIDLDSHCYQQILGALRDDWQSEFPLATLPDLSKSSDYQERRTHFFEVLQVLGSRPLTFLFDDVELLQNYPWGTGFFRKFATYVNRPNTNIKVIMAARPIITDWIEQLQKGWGRVGLWDLIQRPIYLKPLSTQIILDEFYDHPRFAQQLIRLCGGHPHCLFRLTEAIRLSSSEKELLSDLDSKANLSWDTLFKPYWAEYSLLARQICFLLNTQTRDLTREQVKQKFPESSWEMVDCALAQLFDTGIIYRKGKKEVIALIGLFQQWYHKKMGFVETILDSKNDRPKEHETTNVTKSVTPLQKTEFTFLPEEDLVLIKRGRYLYLESFNIPTRRLKRFLHDTKKIPALDGQQFQKNIQDLSEDLWDYLENKKWFIEIVNRTNSRDHLHFNIPAEMVEFPFELLPLDRTGTRRIGLRTPISRQLIQEGQDIDLDPLALLPGQNQSLKILIIAAEVGGQLAIGADGQICDSITAEDKDLFHLDNLRLGDQIMSLYELMTARPDLIAEITFLVDPKHALETNLSNNIIIRQLPATAQRFRALLEDENEQFDLIHFIGHGLVATNENGPLSGGFLFEDSLVHLTALRGLLIRQKQLRFVYLSSCESGQLSTDQRTSDLLGLAHACIEANVPAVLAMRWSISVGASAQLTPIFYDEFFRQGQLHQALCEAISKVYDSQFSAQDKAYAAAPVLIMH